MQPGAEGASRRQGRRVRGAGVSRPRGAAYARRVQAPNL